MAVAGPEGNVPKSIPQSRELGLLAHEFTFVTNALPHAEVERLRASQAVGEANLNSGGDWALDDHTTISAAEESARKDERYRFLKNLYDIGVSTPDVPYPDAEDPAVRIGSRVTIQTPRWEETVDIVTRRIPGMPEDSENEVELGTPESSLGAALLGLVMGNQFSWTSDGTRKFSGVVTGINQTAQREFYERVLSEPASDIEVAQ